MIIKTKVRGFICHHPPTRLVVKPMFVARSSTPISGRAPSRNGPKKVLVIGASTGYGLASRIAAAFGSGAATIGVGLRKAEL